MDKWSPQQSAQDGILLRLYSYEYTHALDKMARLETRKSDVYTQQWVMPGWNDGEMMI